MPFVFTLDAVLGLRVRAEERTEGELADVVRQIAEAQQALARAKADIVAMSGQISTQFEQVCSAFILQHMYAQLHRLQKNRDGHAGRIAELEHLRVARLEAYQLARRDREMLSDLRARERSAFDAARQRREQSTLDEIFLGRRSRR